jgi:hypothetical protein
MSKNKAQFLITVVWNDEMDKYHKREWDEDAQDHYYGLVVDALESGDSRLYINECGYESDYTIKRVSVEEKTSLSIKELKCSE